MVFPAPLAMQLCGVVVAGAAAAVVDAVFAAKNGEHFKALIFIYVFCQVMVDTMYICDNRCNLHGIYLGNTTEKNANVKSSISSYTSTLSDSRKRQAAEKTRIDEAIKKVPQSQR